MKRIDIVMGLACNQGCTFCFNNALDKKYPEDSFSYDAIEQALKSGADDGITSVSLSGGEPTISKDFLRVVKLASSLGYKNIRVVTNGLMFHYPKFAKLAAEAGITQICLSMHGTREVHEKHTRVIGSYDKVLDAIHNIKRYFTDFHLTAHTVLTKDLLPVLDEHVKELIRLGFNAINLLYLMPNSKINKQLVPDRKEVKAVLKDVIDRYKDSIYIHIGYLEPCILPGYEKHFDTNDFDMEFKSNCNELFEDWKQTLLDNKVQKDGCHDCRFLKTCMGFWSPPEESQLE